MSGDGWGRDSPPALRPQGAQIHGGTGPIRINSNGHCHDLPPPDLAEVEREHVERVLGLCGWNRSAAARALGIDRRTLFSKI